MTTNRHGHNVEAGTITKIDESESGYGIDRSVGWGTLFVSKDECNGFVPQVGDAIILFTTQASFVHGVIIENHVIRYKTKKQAEYDRQDMLNEFRLEKLERYIKHGDELKARVEKLHRKFQERMERFVNEADDPVEFWIDSAPYEMICLEGATALLNKTAELFPYPPKRSAISGKFATDEDRQAVNKQRIDWIEEWWNKRYEEQQALVPDFGDGHSGFTASAGKGMAIAVLKGEPV